MWILDFLTVFFPIFNVDFRTKRWPWMRKINRPIFGGWIQMKKSVETNKKEIFIYFPTGDVFMCENENVKNKKFFFHSLGLSFCLFISTHTDTNNKLLKKQHSHSANIQSSSNNNRWAATHTHTHNQTNFFSYIWNWNCNSHKKTCLYPFFDLMYVCLWIENPRI